MIWLGTAGIEGCGGTLGENSAGKWCGWRKEKCFVISSLVMCVLYVNAFVMKEQMLKKNEKSRFF